jgi:hypothetical protein
MPLARFVETRLRRAAEANDSASLIEVASCSVLELCISLFTFHNVDAISRLTRAWFRVRTQLNVYGHLPLYTAQDASRLAQSASFSDGGCDREQQPSFCLCRYVTQPRWRRRHLALLQVAAPTVLHMRTGFADADDAVVSTVAPDPSRTSAWIKASCGTAVPFADGARRVALSDSPGLLRFLSMAHPRHVNVNPRVANMTRRSLRTWGFSSSVTENEMVYAALDDVVLIGLGDKLHIAPQRIACGSWKDCDRERAALNYRGKASTPHFCGSCIGRPKYVRSHAEGFARPAMMRSPCLRHISRGIPECPAYADLFLRDLPVSWMPMRSNPAAALKSRGLLSQAMQAESQSASFQKRTRAGLRNITMELTTPEARIRFELLRQRGLPAQHPCHKPSTTIANCYHDFVAALA